MKKTTTPQLKKPLVVKRQLVTKVKQEDNQEVKKEKVPDTSIRPGIKTTAKKTVEPVTGGKTAKKDSTNATKLRKPPSNPVVIPSQQTRKSTQQPATSSSKAGSSKKPLPGNFNVTVFSPPSARKASETTVGQVKEQPTRDRTRTRTLKPEEVTVLNKIPKIPDVKQPIVSQPKAPVSFDISFEGKKQGSTTSAKSEAVNGTDPVQENDDDQYESEFDSYESDFESGSSRKHDSSAHSAASSSRVSSSSEHSGSSSSDTDVSSSSEDDETRKVRTSNEQKLDSGNYDMQLKRLLDNDSSKVSNLPKPEDNQPDSGMNSGLFETHATLSYAKLLKQRYADILDKTTFNTMCYELYEEQPAPYESFVQNYAQIQGVQNFSQTETDSSTTETQTDSIFYRSCWTQYPPQFSMSTLGNDLDGSSKFVEEKLGVGFEDFHDKSQSLLQDDIYSNFLHNLGTTKELSSLKNPQFSKRVSNFNELHRFLKKCSPVVENVLNRNVRNLSKTKTINLKPLSFSDRGTVSAVNFDRNSRHLLLTLHECDSESSSHHRYIICIWDTRNCLQPEAVLSCWSSVACTERMGSMVFAGTTDGTLCAWDVQENAEEIAPFQLIAPAVSKEDVTSHHHYGGVVALKSTSQTSASRDVVIRQVLALFEAGVLITWILSPIRQEALEENDLQLCSTFFHAKLRLIQQHVINLISTNQVSSIPGRQLSISNNFKKDSLEDLLDIRNTKIDSKPNDSAYFWNHLHIHRNKAVITSNKDILVINYLEQKCSLTYKNQVCTVQEHPMLKDFMFVLSSNNTIKILNMARTVNTKQNRNKMKNGNAKHSHSHANSKFSPVLDNKSCAIQNIVKNERKLYHEASSHTDSLTHSPSSNLDLHYSRTRQENRKGEPLPFHHNQVLFLKRGADQRNVSMYFLDQGQMLCVVGTATNTTLIDLKTGRKSYLSDYITSDFSKHRLLGTTDKQVIMTLDGQEIYLHDIASSFTKA